MIVFDTEGAAGASIIISTITASKGVTDAATALIGNTSITLMGELLQPTRGQFVGLVAKAMLITVETATVNMTLDKSTPTVASGTNLGHQLDAGQSYVIRGENNVANARFINRVASNGAVIKGTIFY